MDYYTDRMPAWQLKFVKFFTILHILYSRALISPFSGRFSQENRFSQAPFVLI